MKKTQAYLLFTLCVIFSHTAQAVDFSLFGDISLSSSTADDEATSFNLGQLDLFTEQELSETSRVTAEIVFEDPGEGFEVDIERLYIRKTLNNGLNIAGGRFHVPLGMWNINFHHGSLIQDTITRPSFLEFEDAQQGIFPAHIVGLYLDGENVNWSYQIAYGNSPAMHSDTLSSGEPLEIEVKNFEDPSDDKTLIARGSFIFGKGSTELGVFAMNNKVIESGNFNALDPLNSALVKHGEPLFEQKTVGLDFRYNADSFYIFTEFFNLDTEDNPDIISPSIAVNLQEYSATAYYAQLGLRLTDRFTLIYRHEDLSFDANSTYLEDILRLTPVNHDILGVNYKIEESHAIKFEIKKTEPEVGDSVTSYTAQWFFLLI